MGFRDSIYTQQSMADQGWSGYCVAYPFDKPHLSNRLVHEYHHTSNNQNPPQQPTGHLHHHTEEVLQANPCMGSFHRVYGQPSSCSGSIESSLRAPLAMQDEDVAGSHMAVLLSTENKLAHRYHYC